ncbi:extracellular solute-binding protein [Mahella australiensis]|uniref:Extracellular solute-binding protein family 1 n=1 Tax=Mahella australiensis (strain DSM 15567 / CIP 107919 / 50-1 BON) TaxID=697281 RepID=F3ZWP0_MAHA5|nr:extracellular solute-binding protein [Mahella australiensis]AEE96483.1 extracellular solute-binding protein family 1 [Mahella australiensis 50-1 BON]
MKVKKLIALVLVLVMTAFVIAGCGSNGAENSSEDTNKENSGQSASTKTPPPEGKDTNNGRPYNLEPVKWDNRNDRYLNGINATILPVTDKPTTIKIWRSFNSTVMKGLDECEVFKELEKRTGVHVEFMYPPVGQETDNFNLRIATNDLPHIFSTPPNYPGGYMKAIQDEVYLDLTPYYDKGLMPNIKWLRQNNQEINRDIVADDGHMYFFPMIDIVPSDPWSGLWVREDWLKELELPLPKTISDWDNMLRAMKQAKGVAPLALNVKDWYGVATNYMFAGSYETGYNFINKDGKAVFGPIEPGYQQFLSKMHEWYSEGLIDPDFATRTYEAYNANIADGKVGACGLAYGEFGQIKLTGQSKDPNFKLTPVLQPTSYEGQEIHLHQDNSTVRGDREFFTTKLVDDGIDEIAAQWKDYWYSQDGGDLCSYGPEGVSYKWNDQGEPEWIYPRLKEEKDADFWTLYPLFKLHNWGYLRDSTSYEFEPEVFECIQLWDTQDSSWLIPDNISYTPEESTEFNNIMTEINTYRDEMTLKFIMGQVPLSEFDDFVNTIKGMNIDRAIEIEQAALDRYFARQ